MMEMRNEPVDLLAFGPHPDDVELNVGGIVASQAQRGRVVVVDLTEGELQTNGTVELRRQESAEAGQILHLHARDNLGIPDGGINPHDLEQQNRVVRSLRKYRPQVVLLPYWEDRHPDHVAASLLIEIAIFKSGLQKFLPEEGLVPHRPRRWYFYLQHQHGTPDLVIDITEFYADKLRAIEAYQSQFQSGAGVQTFINRPVFLQRIRARDQYFGAMIDVQYGEGLICKGPLPVKSILDF